MGPDRRILPDGLTNSSSPPPILVPHPGTSTAGCRRPSDPRPIAAFRTHSHADERIDAVTDDTPWRDADAAWDRVRDT